MANEIERKFLIDRLPGDVVLGPAAPLRQGYVAIDGAVEVRVRISDERAWLTVKAGTGLTRTEVEVRVTTADAEALWSVTEGRRLSKHRHAVAVGAHVADVDVYAGSLEGLCTAEVEFTSVAAAAAFQPPAWFTREVTGDARWSNAALARFGIPR